MTLDQLKLKSSTGLPFFKDPVGYVAGNYQFYFREGLNTLVAREPF